MMFRSPVVSPVRSLQSRALAHALPFVLLTLAMPVRASDLDYPEAKTVQQTDTYHGVEVVDPYRWMETASDERRTWIDAETEMLDAYTRAVPFYEELKARIKSISNFDSFGTPSRRDSRYFNSETKAGERHPILYVQDGADGKPRAFFDVAEHVKEGRRFGGMSPSPDGRNMVWTNLSPGTWGWSEVVRVDDGRTTGQKIQGVAGNSAIWTHDGHGFYYLQYGDEEQLTSGKAEPEARIRYHRLGTDVATDQVVFSTPDRPNSLYSTKLGDSGKYLVIEVFDGDSSVNEVWLLETRKHNPAFPLIEFANARFVFEGNVGNRYFFRTTLDAPNGRLIGIDLDRPQRADWVDVIPQRDFPLNAVSHIGGRLVVRSTKDARPLVEVYSTDGALEYQLDLPSIGLLGGFADDPKSHITYYRFNSLCDPGSIYRCDLTTGESTLYRRPDLDYNPDDYEITQVFYNSADGTRIPMFVAARQGLPRDGSSPMYMYGYGHGGWVAFPWFQPHLVAWLDMGGMYALPGLRGGGEYGKEWQEAGIRLHKQNAIDDYIAAAEYLIGEGYTSADLFVANGGSASGVVPAAAVVQRPELFGAAVIDFPFLDMLRYHEFTTVKGWTRGYGSSDVEEEFAVLASYSPLHNLKSDVCYPAVLTIVGEEDASTDPMHGYKFTAALQAQSACGNPYMVMSIPGAGHYSYGTTPEASIESQAQMIAFLVRALGWETQGLQMGSR